MSKAQPTPIVVPTNASEFVRHCLMATKSLLACELLGLSAGIWANNLLPALRIATIAGLFVAGFVLLADTILGVVIELAERLSQRDLDRDGNVGSFEDRIILVNKRPQQQVHDFAEFVEAAATDPTERRLMAVGFTDKQITLYRDALIGAGWGEWVSTDKRHGWRLTADAGTILRALPSPRGDDDDDGA